MATKTQEDGAKAGLVLEVLRTPSNHPVLDRLRNQIRYSSHLQRLITDSPSQLDQNSKGQNDKIDAIIWDAALNIIIGGCDLSVECPRIMECTITDELQKMNKRMKDGLSSRAESQLNSWLRQ